MKVFKPYPWHVNLGGSRIRIQDAHKSPKETLKVRHSQSKGAQIAKA